MMVQKPLLVGMCNPLSEDPLHSLYPHPPGCTGYRIWQMLNDVCGMSKSEYTRAFDRTNLVDRQKWDLALARARAPMILGRMAGRQTVLMGREVVAALNLPRTEAVRGWPLPGGGTWRYIPHPSGRSHWYNDVGCRAVVALLLEELACGGT